MIESVITITVTLVVFAIAIIIAIKIDLGGSPPPEPIRISPFRNNQKPSQNCEKCIHLRKGLVSGWCVGCISASITLGYKPHYKEKYA